MGVYIKSMEMPENCYRCRFSRMVNNWNKNDEADILFRCVLTGEESWDYTGGYLPNCPLIPVPDHLKLVDKNALLAECEWANTDDDTDVRVVRYDIIKQAPTIIPATNKE